MLPQNAQQQVAPMNQNIPPRFPGSPMSRPQIRNTFSPQMNSPMMRAHNGQQAPMSGAGGVGVGIGAPPQGYQTVSVRFPASMNSPQMAAINGTDRKKQHIPNVVNQLHATPDKGKIIKKKTKVRDKILSAKVREMVPESQGYMDLVAFERKLDATIMRKRLDIQEALKRPLKIKKNLRIFISNQFYPGKSSQESECNQDEDIVSQWELRIEGRLHEENKTDANTTTTTTTPAASKVKRKFSSFFKSLVIELDKDLYGPDNHLVEWHRTPQTSETDGFQVKRAGDQNVKCTILMLLDYQPQQYKLDARLSRILGLHTATRPAIIQAFWQYIKTKKLQNNQEKEFIDCDAYLKELFKCDQMKFSEIPNKLHMFCMPPDPIVINHVINIEGADLKTTSIYDIDVEIDDTIKDHMKNFLNSNSLMQDIATLDSKINENIEQINQLRINREFFLSFSDDPQDFIHKWIISQSRDLKTMKDTNTGSNGEDERLASFYQESWTDEAVSRYFFNKVQQRRGELEQVLGIKNA